MNNMPSKKKLKKMYWQDNLSMKEISNNSPWSYHQVVYWMKKHDIPRRTYSEAVYIKSNPEGDPFDIKRIKTQVDRKLFHLAIGLYLGEGNKKSHDMVRIGNSDPKLLNIFLQFLRKICRVKESKIKAELNIFDDVDIEKAKKFWLKKLDLKASQLKTVTIRKHNKKGTYRSKSTYGTFTTWVANVKLKRQIDNWCKQITGNYN